ncbi:MAG: TonB family protein [Deltaproteobacteria bacterium]
MKKTLALLLSLGLVCPSWSFAADGAAPEAQGLYVGEMKVIAVKTPNRVVIGNPGVADVLSVSEKELIIAGKGPGATNLVWWDADGQKSMSLRVYAEDMTNIKQRVDDLIAEMGLTGLSTKTADSEGKVLLMGSVKTQEQMDRIKSGLGPLFNRVTNLVEISDAKAIVELDVEVIEVDRDASKTLGIQWPSAVTGTEPVSNGTRLLDIPKSLINVTHWNHDQLSVALDLLMQEGKARILSRPRLACQSGKEAELLVGGEKPIMNTTVSATNGGSGTNIEYKEYGIKLKMAPLYTDGKIRLSMNVDVSDIGAPTTLGSTGGGVTTTTALAYPLIKRSTSTQLYLNNGQTLAISGLIRQKTTEDLQKVPWLGDIPVLGVFFRHRTTVNGGGNGERGDIELVIMVTPKVVLDAGQPEAAPSAAKDEKVVAQPVTPELVKAVSDNVDVVRKAAGQQADTAIAAVDPQSAYGRSVTQYFLSKLQYPSLAKRTKTEGTVQLALHIARDGGLLDVSIKKASGFSVLDSDALSTAKEIQPYPTFPAAIADKDLWITVPIEYSLAGRR